MWLNTSYAKRQYWQRRCWMASSGAPTRPRLASEVSRRSAKHGSHHRDISRQDGLRPVIYYLEHLVQDMESQMLSRALVSFVKFKHPRTIMHPILTFVLDLLWENLVPWSPKHTKSIPCRSTWMQFLVQRQCAPFSSTAC